MSLISDNLKRVQENIEKAALKSGRNPSDITLVGVTKTVGVDRIRELLDLGVADLGENRVQELVGKYEELGSIPNWHMIGHLQTNKVKYIIDKVTLIHSVDSFRLAQEIDRQSKLKGKVTDILLQVNIADEATKFGVKKDETRELAEKACMLSNICIKGLMTVAPYVENKEENRIIFENFLHLFVDMKGIFSHNTCMTFLSMGMSNDYEIAIEQGANMVRIGAGIFGERT